MTYVIAEPCVDLLDKACIEECPVDCIYEGGRMLYIHPDECVDCGACEPVCPVEAIYYEDDVPEQWAAYTKANVDFFDDLGSPGGASKVGKTEMDVEPAKSLRRRLTTNEGCTRARTVSAVKLDLPDFPWDSLAEDKATAQAHPDGIVDLSVGTPVDPVPAVVRDALCGPAADEPGYPTTHGPASLREALTGSLLRRFGVTVDPQSVLPTIGSKEFVAWLPTLLGVGPGDAVVIPELAYPTYEVGARLAHAEFVRSDSPTAVGPGRVALVWVNSPSNPTGRVLPPDHLRRVIGRARQRGAVVASDECYLSLSKGAVSILHPDVCGGSHEGLLAVHSMSKSSNLAGYRAGFVAGDPALVAELLEVRKHAGMIVPRPVQAAMEAAASDDTHVAQQVAVYERRRILLRTALETAGLRIDHSEAGLYLWATAGEPGRATVRRLAELGILVAPGDFYGPAGAEHVRVGLTASDERITTAATRLLGG